MKLEQTVAPTVEPLSVTEAKGYLRVDHTTDDTQIESVIKAARRSCERFQNRLYITQTWKMYLDHFPAGGECITIPHCPLQSVTSITYVDTNGDTQTLSSSLYQVDAKGVNPKVVLAPGVADWPSTQTEKINAVTITYVGGYGNTASTVPENIRAAIQLMLSDLYYIRDNTVVGNTVNELPMGVKYLLWQGRRYRV